jgi:hypothetical protein
VNLVFNFLKQIIMKELSFEQMEELNGGNNMDKAMCTLGTISWAVGALTVATGLGLALWGVGAIGVAYCNYRMVF